MQGENEKKNTQKPRAIQLPEAKAASDLAAELSRADETLANLRLEVRTVLTKYRLWRAHMRCGRAADTGLELFNMPMVKKIRGLLATYRFAQMVRADIMHMIALENETRQKLVELDSLATYGFKPELVSYDELEARYGGAIAQQLYDDMLSQTARQVAKRKLVS